MSASPLSGFRLVSLLTLISRLLGMLRDAAMAAAFGAGPVMDAFSVAFRIPNLARRLFGEGAQTFAFLPAFIRAQEQEGLTAAQQLAGGMFQSLGLLLIAVVGATEAILTLIWWLAPLSPDAALLVELLMWLLPYLICICLAAQQSAVMHALRQFGWPAALPIALNVVWLTAIPASLLFTDEPAERMRLLCMAIVLAGVVQMGIPMLVLRRAGFPITAPRSETRERVKEVFVAMAPVLLGVTVTQINTVFDSVLAWWLAPGSDGVVSTGATGWLPVLPNGTASALYFGQRMYHFPLGLIGVGLGTVLFPQLTRHAERGDTPQLNRDLTIGLKLAISIGLPAGTGLMLLATPITRLLFEHGAFTPDDSALTSRMIVAYGFGVAPFISLLIVRRGYYAVGDRITPVRHGLIAMTANILLDFALLYPLGAAGLAWATSLAACLQFGLSLWFLQCRIGQLPWRAIGVTLLQTVVACTAMGLVCRLTLPEREAALVSRVIAALQPVIAGAATYFAVASLIRLREPWQLLRHGTIADDDGS